MTEVEEKSEEVTVVERIKNNEKRRIAARKVVQEPVEKIQLTKMSRKNRNLAAKDGVFKLMLLTRREEAEKRKEDRAGYPKMEREVVKTDKVLIVTTGIPQGMRRGFYGSWVFRWEERERVLSKLKNPKLNAFESWINWDTDAYLSHDDNEYHLWKAPSLQRTIPIYANGKLIDGSV